MCFVCMGGCVGVLMCGWVYACLYGVVGCM